MDLFNIVYYGAICGVLGVSAPLLSRRAVRFGVGIGVGVLGAMLLPVLRSMTMGY
jgi:hypothetical protein